MSSSNLRRRLFLLGCRASRMRSVLSYYREFQETQMMPYEWLVAQQEERLRVLIRESYERVPYYRKLFDLTGVRPSDIRTIEDLQKLPILTKEIIRSQANDMKPSDLDEIDHVHGSTGGSTGVPLRFWMSLEDRNRGIALLYRGWGNGGYQLGDKIAIIAGSSLIPSSHATMKTRIRGCILNADYYSSYGMDTETVASYIDRLNRVKPKFIRGYASAIYYVAKLLLDTRSQLSFKPAAVFTTAEMLLEQQRDAIESAFGAPVFDNYGLNDGGLSAFECCEHRGLHIDTERSILEIVDESGRQLIGQPGRILGTSLYNSAFPFVRYETGDIGALAHAPCACGRRTPRLTSLLGRVTDLLTINGRAVGSPILTVLFGKFDIEQYQIVQTDDQAILCRIVKGATYTRRDEETISRSLRAHLGTVEIAYEYTGSMEPHEGAKHKFIIDRRVGAS